eukprot:scpid10397/ scgid27470/ 
MLTRNPPTRKKRRQATTVVPGVVVVDLPSPQPPRLMEPVLAQLATLQIRVAPVALLLARKMIAKMIVKMIARIKRRRRRKTNIRLSDLAMARCSDCFNVLRLGDLAMARCSDCFNVLRLGDLAMARCSDCFNVVIYASRSQHCIPSQFSYPVEKPTAWKLDSASLICCTVPPLLFVS